MVGLQISESAMPTQLADTHSMVMTTTKTKNPVKMGSDRGGGQLQLRFPICDCIFCAARGLPAGTQKALQNVQGPSSGSLSMLDNHRFHLYNIQLSGHHLNFQAWCLRWWPRRDA